MCGRFSAILTWKEYCALAGISGDGGGEGSELMDPDRVLPTFTPMSAIPILHLNEIAMRRIAPMRWGWHKPSDPIRGFSHLHARAEEIDTRPTWAEPFRKWRGIAFTKSFNIGEELPDGRIKQWVCSRADGKPVAIAFLYAVRETLAGPLHACVMVTTESCPPLSLRDNRMPAPLDGENAIRMWLGEAEATIAQVKALLRPPGFSLVIHEQTPSGKRSPPPARPRDSQADLFWKDYPSPRSESGGG